MAVNIGKTKYIIFQGKWVNLDGMDIVYDDNEPLGADPHASCCPPWTIP